MTYEEFLKSKAITVQPCGFDCTDRNPKLFDWQNDVVRWALRKGKAAIFAGCGNGKTACQLWWAQKVHEHAEGNILILAPLAVAQQTKREGEKFGVPVTVCRSQADVKPGVNITNYEMLQHFDPDQFVGIVLDESSILKQKMGKTSLNLREVFANTKYKLCCTATPSPNDFMELGTHAEFLGVMKQTEMLATFFVHDGGETQKWRLKGHAEKKFFEWVAGWACCFNRPQDIGYQESGYELSVWQRYADPVWMDIDQSDTLQYKSVKDEKDEKHLAPLQLGVCQRAIELWTNPHDTVLTPFLGIGSEAYMAVKMGRKAVGIELKESYFRQAVANVKSVAEDTQGNLFEMEDS